MEHVQGIEFFHLAKSIPYSRFPPMETGGKFSTGDFYNPFFDFYQAPKVYPVQDNGQEIPVKAIRFLSLVREEKIHAPDLPNIALDIAKHFVMLTREIIMEQVRLDICPNSPSRQRCLWLIENKNDINTWKKHISEHSGLFKVRVSGRIQRADAGLLLGDSELIEITYEKARRYWRGELSGQPEIEILFEGEGIVLEKIDI